MLTAIAYRILDEKTKEVYLEGIVEDEYSSIYPAQVVPGLKEDFPELPSECELRYFKVNGLKLETKNFKITWEQVLKCPEHNPWS